MSAAAQDVIVKKDGSTIISKVLEVNTVRVRPVTLVVEHQNLLQLLGAAAAEFNGQSHRENIVLNSDMETTSPRSTSAISSSISGVTWSTPSTIRA